MGYVHHDRPDIFVSYAHVDDEPVPDFAGGLGWVTALVRDMEREMAKLLGRRDSYDLWSDAQLKGHVQVPPEILGKLQNSAVLVLVLSPGYLASPWCGRELTTFHEEIQRRNSSTSRVFVVESQRVEKPSQLAGLTGYRFWVENPKTRHPETLGSPSRGRADTEYHSQVNRLCSELAEQLKALQRVERDAPRPSTKEREARRDDVAAQRKTHREQIVGELDDLLNQFVAEKHLTPGALAEELRFAPIPEETPTPVDAIANHLLDEERCVPILIRMIGDFTEKHVLEAAKILGHCLDLISPYHFFEQVRELLKDRLSPTGGGFHRKAVTTECGAELVMAALDQSRSEFDPSDPKLPGVHAKRRGPPPLGKMSVLDDANKFLASVYQIDKDNVRAKKHGWYEIASKRRIYCIVPLPEDSVDRDYVEKVLTKVGELLPGLPVFLLSPEGPCKDEEVLYRDTLKLRFFRRSD